MYVYMSEFHYSVNTAFKPVLFISCGTFQFVAVSVQLCMTSNTGSN